MLNQEWPQEKLVEFENDPFFLGRISVFPVKNKFHAEIDIIQKESVKIYKHIGSLYNLDTVEDAFELGFRELRLKLMIHE